MKLSDIDDLFVPLLAEKGLPKVYLEQMVEMVFPLVSRWLSEFDNSSPQIWGVQGCQGSGKTTLCDFLAIYIEQFSDLKAKVCSIDDFYLTKKQRQNLAEKEHSLLNTRGVPGTHDVDLIMQAFDDVKNNSLHTLPVFSKADDDRIETNKWPVWNESPDLLIFEGWCVGLTPQANDQLHPPINELEMNEDKQGQWRVFVNTCLQNEYAGIFSNLDKLLSIQAPSFDCVYEWRSQQEKQLAQQLQKENKATTGLMTDEQIKRFISHYERLTKHAFNTMGSYADAILTLNKDHTFDKMYVT